MKWRKLGRVYAPAGDLWWARRYATIPTVEILDDRTLRVYFASLDENNFGRIGSVDVDACNPTRVLRSGHECVLDIGEPGTFDDSGVNPVCLITINGRRYLYYIGWQRTARVPYMLFLGLATAEGEAFTKITRTPVLERTTSEPFLRSAASIIRNAERWTAWYVSGVGWIEHEGRSLPSYVIRRAESGDGIRWETVGAPCISFENPDEFGFGRPWVIAEDGIYRMWYSIRSRVRPYRIGYAESVDGAAWTRKDAEVGIDTSPSGWDSEMICYPCVVDAAGKRYLFYNGNRHGLTGFGVAVQES